MKRIAFLTLFAMIVSLFLVGCQLRPSEIIDQTDDKTSESSDTSDHLGNESDNSSDETTIPRVDPDTVVGISEYDLITTDPDSKKLIISSAQTNLGDLCADAYRLASDSDIAIVFGREINSGISRGEITIGDLYDVFINESNLVTVSISGTEILDLFETIYLDSNESDFAHLSGISHVLNRNNSPSFEKDANGALVDITGERRISDVKIADEPIQPDNAYTLAVSLSAYDHISTIYKVLSEAEENDETNRSALIKYISDTLSGTLSDEYSNPYGNKRTLIVPLGQTEPPASKSLSPQIYITVNDTVNRTKYIPCTVTVHDPTGVYDDIFDTESTIKIRGHSTSSGVKSPYNIKFSSKLNLLGLGEGKKWNMLANLYDKTQLRNILAYSFAQDVGIEYTSNSRFAEVYVNGVYSGLYQICEPVAVGKTRVDINIDDNDFLLEVEPYEGYSNDYCLITPHYNIILGYNEPEAPTYEQRQWLYSFITNVEDAIMSGDYNRVIEYVDVESVARNYIVQELFKNVDYFQSSTRFYVKDNKLYEGPVWDFDLSMGNCSKSYYPAYNNVDTSGNSYEGIYNVTLYNKQLFAYEEFRNLVCELYEKLQPLIINLYRDNELGQCMIDRLLDVYGNDIDRNNTLWTTTAVFNIYEHNPVDGTYEGEIKYLKNWLEERNKWLYDYYCQGNS
ncbi:MAG: hypothetical protein E7672_02945 [Ruminococcaceae bacterium]|nr:hypothetical protein [Oscillospiraceae bacterium]